MLSASSAFRWLRSPVASGTLGAGAMTGRSVCGKTSPAALLIFLCTLKTKNPPTGSSGGGLVKSLLLRLLKSLGYPPARQTHARISVQQQVQVHAAFAE